MLDEKDLASFCEFFRARTDTYGVQSRSGSYTRVDADLTLKEFRAHLRGHLTIGTYLIDPSTNKVHFAVIDHDERNEESFRKLVSACVKVGLKTNEVLLEDSGNKGRHIIFRFTNAIDASKAKRFCETIVALSGLQERIEVFPKQDKVEMGGFGNLVKLPLGIHRKSGRRSCFLDPQTLTPIESIKFEHLARIEENKVESVLSSFDLANKSFHRVDSLTPIRALPLKEAALPCIDNVLANGSNEGTRDLALFNLCIYLKGKNLPREKALLILIEWDKKNRPPLNTENPNYIQQKVDYLYDGKYSHVSCNEMRVFCRTTCPYNARSSQKNPGKSKISFGSFVNIPNKLIAEMTFDPVIGAGFALQRKNDASIEHVERFVHDDIEYIPFKDDGILGKAILLPSGASEYESDMQLLEAVRTFIHDFLDIGPLFEKLCAYYVLFTYVADGFDVCPYLRFHGDYGSGKSRALLTIGSLCYKATICSGAITASPIFRLIDKYHGTLVIDEADFEHSDATQEIIKILNQGYMQRSVVLRSQEIGRSHEAVAFQVYGPKLLATRFSWKDKALESRCLTVLMRGRQRDDIPINLDIEKFEQRALSIRNKLTLWRLRNFGWRTIDESMRQVDVEDRINQIMLPLASIITDPEFKTEYAGLVQQLQRQLLSDRTLSRDCDVAEAILSLAKGDKVSVKEVTDEVNRNSDDLDRLSRSAIGKIIKSRFGFSTIHTRKGNYVHPSDTDLQFLRKKYRLYEEVDNNVNV